MSQSEGMSGRLILIFFATAFLIFGVVVVWGNYFWNVVPYDEPISTVSYADGDRIEVVMDVGDKGLVYYKGTITRPPVEVVNEATNWSRIRREIYLNNKLVQASYWVEFDEFFSEGQEGPWVAGEISANRIRFVSDVKDKKVNRKSPRPLRKYYHYFDKNTGVNMGYRAKEQ